MKNGDGMIYLLWHGLDLMASRRPEQQAVRYSSQALSYGQLARRSNSLAHTLLEQGVKRGDRVGIYMNKGLESAVAIYGIMKAGAAYVPLDPFAPAGRLAYVIEDCGIRCLVSAPSAVQGIEQLLAEGAGLECVIGVEDRSLPLHTLSWSDVIGARGETAPDLGTTEQDLAYILYTSGSTGDPKGIMHTHRSGLSFAHWAAATYRLSAEDILSNHAPLHFDLSTFDFFAASLVGATTVIIPEALTRFPANVTRLIEQERISVWYSVPFALIQILLRGAPEKHDLSSLRWVLFAGEPFPTKHLRDLMAHLPDVRFSNLYGPTETNVCTYYHVPPLPEGDDEPIPIGRPCANVQALVVDNQDRPVAAGEVGELLIRGPLLMRGYWGRPDLTERGFYRRPAFEHYQDLFYRTGDLVQSDDHGNFIYLGRKDRQVKTRGYRVELDEIEVALLSYQGVAEAAVYTVPDGQGSNLIEAAVTVQPEQSVTDSELTEHVARRLPPYALPTRITVMDSFPRTSTGKINRRELQALALQNNGAPLRQQNRLATLNESGGSTPPLAK